ncbi:unnamed protein product [Brachionus calyciflorus]|uniref:THO complex subunit 2 n=1 Tax=Brachionus calyciflorus TaxID=104777 RepID=A0A813MMK4_9BILA|nr:unnamed protein product [Brachionus calyciflorus]
MMLFDQTKEDELKFQIMESMWKTIDGQTKQDQLINFLNEQKESYGKHFESLLADVISLIDVEINSFGVNSNNECIISSNDLCSENGQNPIQKKDKFYSLVQSMRAFVGDDLLKERLDIESLEALKLIVKKEAFNQKYIKIKTRLFYKQQKFNLLREESEGYSKLISELGQSSLNNKLLENIQSLIGCFNLDPNRVLDIILESFENNAQMYETFLALLKHYKADDDTICQIIGFKYQSLHNLNQKNDDPPSSDSLYLVTSYLLKYAMIDLDSLLPHLYPTEQQITQSYKEEFESARQYAKKLTSINLSESTGNESVPSQLDDNTSSSKSTSNITVINQSANVQQQLKETKKLENQKINLLKNLISIGDFKTAIKLIDKLPQWYIGLYVDQSKSICKSLDRLFVDKMYKKYNLLSKYMRVKLLNESDESEISNNQDQGLGLLEDFMKIILPILLSIGPSLAYDSILFTKLIRICIAFLDSKKFTSTLSNEQKESSPAPDEILTNKIDPSQILETLNPTELDFYNQIYTLLNEIFLPALSMIQMNPCIAIELWNLMKLFPYEMRYNLYNNWRLNTYKHFPLLVKARADCQEKIKYLLKRLTKENVKIHGRQIGKLSHNNPIIVCDYILAQIQRFDNFILPVVESLKFMTPLSYDVLSYSIIISLSDPDKDKMKHDSTNISSWLQSIANFCALTFKKYPIELIAMIQYVIDQLKMRKSHDLLILQEIVQKMSGIEVLSEVNDLQLEAMAGGDLLRQEAGYFNPIRNIKKCANRLKEALADHGLILPLCILLSQQRDYIVFQDAEERQKQMFLPESEKTHLKLIGSFYDQSQDSLVQFSQFLSSTLTTEEYIHIFPKIDELVQEYHVSPDIAFFLSRPMYAHHIQSKYEEFRRLDRNTKSVDKPSKTQRYLESIEHVMKPVIDLARSLHPAKIWEDMSPLFYTTFWTLSMSDCFVPSSAYDKQRASLKQKLSALDDNVELTSAKKKKEKEKLSIMLDKLAEEENKQKDHVQHVRARFEKEKDLWFPQKSKTKNETITVFLQLCIFSRCLFTQIDSFYCSKFIQIIHSLKTPNFSTIICYDRIFSDISYSIASLTDNEARRYGRFLLGLLETVMTWHSDPQIFENECANYPGFLTVFRNASTSNASTSSNKQEPLDYENFRHVCHKWHYKLTKSFIVCLESEEYLQMRNSLIILTKILPFYPKLSNFCSALEKRVEKIKQTEKDKRQDIFTLASAYLGQLKQRKNLMLDESKFHIKEQVEKTNKTAQKDSNFKQPLPATNGPTKPSASPQIKKEPVSSSTIKKDKETSQTNGRAISKNSSSPKKEEQKTNGSSSSTKISTKRPSSPLPLTPTKNGNGTNDNPDYSPTSNISSEDLDSSPRREQHSRSQSPKYKSDLKSKRAKVDDVNGQKRKSSRERDRITDLKDQSKKEHRKREHSSDISSDVQHKRSKSDEKSKSKTMSSSVNSTSSSSQPSSSQQSSKRGSKKHDEKDEYSSSSQNSSQSGSQKKSDDKRERDDRRGSSYYKDKK